MNKKECIWKIFSLCIGIVVIVCAAFIIWQIKQTETLEPTSEKNINSNYFANPDRIVYKIKEENKKISKTINQILKKIKNKKNNNYQKN